MGAPLQDITIYYDGDLIKDTSYDWDFSRTVNYITDFYHNELNGYKPSKTGRICIHLSAINRHERPDYFGAICNYYSQIDEHKYVNLSKQEKYRYILDLLHSAISKLAEIYFWDKEIFDNAYKQIIESGYKFEKYYPEKKSPNKKRVGQIILEKTEDRSVLYALLTGTETSKREVLLEKRNWYWYDSVYKLAKSCKWFDDSSFGIYKGEKNCYYSIEDDKVKSDLIFGENNP
jgi:hypothetical protein